VRRPTLGWPGRPQNVAPATGRQKGELGSRGPPRERCPPPADLLRWGSWRPVPGGSTLVTARTAPVVDARHRRDAEFLPGARISRDRKILSKESSRRGADLPGRPQGEAHISTERQEAGQAARLPSPHVDQGRPGDPVGPPAQGPSQPDRLIWAVRDRATFDALRTTRRRVRRGPITVAFAPGDPAMPPRVAYAIGRRAGGAVVRNRIRRRLRAIAREVRGQLQPGAYLFGATAAASSLSFADLRATVCSALAAVHARPSDPVASVRAR
jgi:ribonuclease P protein component